MTCRNISYNSPQAPHPATLLLLTGSSHSSIQTQFPNRQAASYDPRSGARERTLASELTWTSACHSTRFRSGSWIIEGSSIDRLNALTATLHLLLHESDAGVLLVVDRAELTLSRSTVVADCGGKASSKLQDGKVLYGVTTGTHWDIGVALLVHRLFICAAITFSSSFSRNGVHSCWCTHILVDAPIRRCSSTKQQSFICSGLRT